jgi:hypothetical protein
LLDHKFHKQMETYLDFNQNIKIPKSPTYIINWEREATCIINIYIYIERERD